MATRINRSLRGMDMKGFSQRCSEIAETIQGQTDEMMRVVALKVDTYVVLATPVDTGRARANWLVGIERPVTTATEETNFNSVLMNNAQLVQAAKDIREIIISNNLPYIGKLNEGHSKQAAPGFVQAAVLVGVRAARSVKLTQKSNISVS